MAWFKLFFLRTKSSFKKINKNVLMYAQETKDAWFCHCVVSTSGSVDVFNKETMIFCCFVCLLVCFFVFETFLKGHFKIPNQNSAIIHCSFDNCTFPTVTCQHVLCGLSWEFQDLKGEVTAQTSSVVANSRIHQS